jgi:hypothetical protein
LQSVREFERVDLAAQFIARRGSWLSFPALSALMASITGATSLSDHTHLFACLILRIVNGSLTAFYQPCR